MCCHKEICGVRVARGAPAISHMLADDNILFARAREDECHNIMKILQTYSEDSGQMVNLDKCQLTFSPSVLDETRLSFATL